MNMIMLSDETKEMLAEYKHKNRVIILNGVKGKRKFVSWDSAIRYLLTSKGGK